ncbi:MAG: chromosome segregation protein SMC [Candidatus Dormibacteria bacterium]
MRISRLQVQGFKSFATRSELELGPGITAVVGPNGSGKSNLVDAIRLVLGGASARELRGQRLEQVIFGGGERRAALGMAEVTLVFDNEDSRLPVEDVEVALTRRVYRDGTSEFRRNGARVRLRDLGRLLDATGLTQAGYSVIAQNDIESIIRATPAQRRHLVEEAAGVRGAQALLDDSRARLRSLDQWLEGSAGRLAELLPRIDSLREEAVAAQEASGLRSRLGQLRGSLERAAWLAAVAAAQRVERQLQTGLKRREQAALEFGEYDIHYSQQRQLLQQAQASRLELERRAGQLALRLQQMESAGERWGDRAQQAAAAREAAARQRSEVQEDVANLRQPTASEADHLALQAQKRLERTELEQDLAQLVARRDELQTRLTARDEEGRRLRLELNDISRRRVEAGAVLSSLQVRVERTAQTNTALAGRVEEAQSQLAQAEGQEAAAESAAKEAAAELERAVSSEAAALEVLRAAEQAVAKVTQAEREAAAQVAAQKAVLASRREGRSIAEAAGRGELPVRPLGASLRALSADDGRAVEAGLGQLAAALIGSADQARAALSQAGGAAELVCWPVPGPELTQPAALPGCRPLVLVVQGTPEDVAVVGRNCHEVCLAESRAAAGLWLERFPNGRAVLPDGAVLGVGLEITPAVAGGDLEAFSKLDSELRTAELQQAQLEQAQRRLDWARKQHQGQRARVDHSRAKASSSAAQLEASRREQGRLADQLRELRRRLGEVGGELAAESRQLADGGADEATLGLELERVALVLESVERDADALRVDLGDLAAPARAAGEKLEAVRLELAELEMEARARLQREAAELQRLAQLEERGRAAEQRLSEAEGAALVALAMAAQAEATARDLAGELAGVREQARLGLAAADPLQQLAGLERTRAELESALAAASTSVNLLEQELSGQREQVEQLRRQMGPPLVGPEESADDGARSPERVAQEISRMERRLAGLGPVNELAPQQLVELLTRTEGLRSAHEDTAAARQDLEAVMARLETVSSGRFEETLDRVTREFELVWKELFGGGRATLVLTGGDGAAGVDLEVQPQGKRVIPMALLSGGERALTALALVLALQEVSPSPFYVFDEVDAALDEVNVANFARLLKSRSARSQFLVVTHSLTTMAMASHLYGVTQDGRGSSRVLSVRLADDGQTLEEADSPDLAEAGLLG